MSANRLEKYEIVKMMRGEIQGAPYNPRKITPKAAKNLRQSLRKHGILAPITVNKRTGNVVGGHQRLAAMDTLLKKDDYELHVALVDMTEENEVQANIVMNNPSAMGEWDEELLAGVRIDFPEVDFEKDLFFDKFDIDLLFSGTEIEEEMSEAFAPQAEIKDEAERLAEIDNIKRIKKEHREKAREDNESGETHMLEKDDYMVTIVFDNNQEKHDFMAHINEKAAERYIRATKIYGIQDGSYKAYGPLD